MGLVGGGLKDGGVMWCGLVCVCSLEDARCWVVRGGFAVVVVQEVGNGGVWVLGFRCGEGCLFGNERCWGQRMGCVSILGDELQHAMVKTHSRFVMELISPWICSLCYTTVNRQTSSKFIYL